MELIYMRDYGFFASVLYIFDSHFMTDSFVFVSRSFSAFFLFIW